MAEKFVSVKAAKKKLYYIFRAYATPECIKKAIFGIFDKLPAADVAPVKHGNWILLRESEITGFNPEFAGRDPIGSYQCSNCKKEAILDCNDEFVLSSYCPNCGAKMTGGEENE